MFFPHGVWLVFKEEFLHARPSPGSLHPAGLFMCFAAVYIPSDPCALIHEVGIGGNGAGGGDVYVALHALNYRFSFTENSQGGMSAGNTKYGFYLLMYMFFHGFLL